MRFEALKRVILWILAVVLLQSSFHSVWAQGSAMQYRGWSRGLEESGSDYLDRVSQYFASELLLTVRDTLDASHGDGSGQMAIGIHDLSLQLERALGTVRAESDFYTDDPPMESIVGRVKESLGACAQESGFCSKDGRYQVPVHQYRSVIKRANQRLSWMNLGDSVEIVQTEEARLLEAFYQYTQPSFMTEQKLLSPHELIGLSQKLYGDLPSGSVAIPFVGWDENDTAKVFRAVSERFAHMGVTIKFVSRVGSVEDVPLPRDDEPLPRHKKRNDRVKTIRYGLFPAMASLGVGASTFPKGMMWSGGAQMLAWSGLEIQFAKLSGKFWNKIWYKYGFSALALVNFLVPFSVATVASAVALTAGEIDYQNIAAGLPEDTKWTLFGKATFEAAKKNITWTLGLFMSSFAAMQVIMSKEKAFGETSEGKRLIFESVTGSGPQLARGILAASSFLVTQMAMVNVLGMGVRIDDFIGYSIQTAFALFISVPLGFKIWRGDQYFDHATGRIWSGASLPEPDSAFTGVKRACGQLLSSVYRFYTFKRL